MSEKPISYAVIRGKVIDTDLIEFGGRGGDINFLAPDPDKIARLLPLGSPARMSDLYRLSFDEILDYLEELGKLLEFSRNEYMQEACEASYFTAPVTPGLVRGFYEGMPQMFERHHVRRWVEAQIPIPYLEGWVEENIDGTVQGIRAFGSRALHIVAGNGPVLGAMTMQRGAVTRSDTIIKAPSNDPFTTGAIARTMVDFAPDHPITKHFSVAYWRGGDESFEKQLYQPHNIEKIIAWGGMASVKHVTRYIQPGLELMSLDPKRSASIVGRDAVTSEELLRETARRLAADVGTLNQTACVSSRVCYVQCGTDDTGLETISRLGSMVYEEIMNLPADVSTRPKRYDPALKSEVDALRISEEWYEIFGGQDGEGAVIVSRTPDAVDFVDLLADRTVNLVPVDTMDEVLGVVDASTQTIGVFPESLLHELRDQLALHGGQRLVALGYVFVGPGFIGPQDGLEPLRRMVKWIVSQEASTTLAPMWERKAGDSKFVA